MRILHLCLGNFFIDNYSYQENMLTKYHVMMGHEVTVIASLFSFGADGIETTLPGPSEYNNVDGVHVIRLAYKRPVKLYKFLRRFVGLREAIERIEPEIIFSHNVSYSDTTVVVDYLKHHPHVQLFADNHADYVNSAKNWLSKYILHPIIWRHYAKLLEPYLLRCYGVTPMRCRFLKEMYKIQPGLIEFLPMGVDDEAIPLDRDAVRADIRSELGICANDIVVFTGGKIDRLKNTHILINAIEKMNNSHLHLIICGTLTPEMSQLKYQIENNSRIHYLGWCSAKKIINCMVAADFACFPGTHSTLWEQAIGLGLPAIYKRWFEMEHVNVNDNCLLIKGEDENGLIVALTRFLDTDFRSVITQKAVIASNSFLYSQIAYKAINS